MESWSIEWDSAGQFSGSCSPFGGVGSPSRQFPSPPWLKRWQLCCVLLATLRGSVQGLPALLQETSTARAVAPARRVLITCQPFLATCDVNKYQICGGPEPPVEVLFHGRMEGGLGNPAELEPQGY